VLGSVRGEIVQERRAEAIKGEVGFCMEYFSEIMTNRVYLMSGNRCDFKQASDLAHFLFDFDDGRIRAH
jgi:hypothetical protein